MTDLIRSVASLPVADRVQATERGLEFYGDLTYEEWEELGVGLQRLGRAWQWWVGDWLNYGEHRWGEKYAQAVEVTGSEEKTLRNAVYVCGNVEMSRRRDNLSFSHHAEVASLDPDEQDALLSEAEERDWSRNQLRDAVRHYRHELEAVEAGPEPETCRVEELDWLLEQGWRFGTIYADPPWQYGNQGTRGATSDHYETMDVDEIADLPVAELAADNAHLHLWTTNAFLFDAREVMEAWGFEYKSAFVWVKPQMGMGNYYRVSHEYCLLGVRGSTPFRERDQMSWRKWDRCEHSAKPGRMYEIIESVSPRPYLELFARRQREGWVSWGNEIERDLFFQAAS